MAASCLSRLSLQNVYTFCTRSIFSSSFQVHCSRYNPHFLEPTVDKTELSSALDESDLRRFRPIKAARTEQTSSLFADTKIQKFTNLLMIGGRKEESKRIMDKTLENIKCIQLEKYHKAPDEEKSGIECNPVAIFHQAIENCKPMLILTKVVRGGISYQVPVPCNPSMQQSKAMKWLIHSCRDKERKLPMEQKLAWEMLDAYRNEGKTVRRKQELHKQCDANRAYAQFRWS
ncbi:28S ribosomal protein S7, mitochondrial-like [Gigantopelta aegis]|uniref:28S ribosomal protein S7, mitochondrial-like n=1 Tax=Gigantopelta aegis TaxID=1735272 RepID=UPI001B888C11|nr:28S ribosomal protein S7, mitochondrial-like [Gigantopelta aegis]